ncbi:ABC transporter substrate-binding protein [Eubacterium sp. MSJ-13]|uniref:ABC transporter substrate-binding protein n=1 Tax=Eubacterium sp. MSJ-13 TaxID=2841513 RepID=UPI0035301860
MRMKKFLAATLTAAMVFSLTACGGSSDSSSGSNDTASSSSDSSNSGGDEKISIGFAQVGHESDWRTASTESCRTTFSEENGYDLKFVDCDNKSADQLEAVRNFIEQEVDYIIIDPIVTTGWDTVLKEAKDAGIPVLVIDRTIEADKSLYTAWVGSDFTAEGQAAGAWLKEYLNAKKITKKVNIVTIAGTNGSSAQIGRTKGFNQYVKSNGWNLLDEQDGDFTQDGGQKIMESYLKSYKDIDVVVCQNDNEAFGAIDALKAAGKTYGKDGDIIIISFDATNAGLTDVKDGAINADFECNPLAAPYVEDIIKKLKDGGTPDSQEIYVDEACFACDDTVTSFKTDEDKDITMTVVDDKVLKERAY